MKRLLTIHCEPTPKSWHHDGVKAATVVSLLNAVLHADGDARVVRRADGMVVYVSEYRA